jgi:branched-chain amino acid transport system permease protein
VTGFLTRGWGTLPHKLVAIVGIAAAALAVSETLSDYRAQQVTLWVIYGILALSLVLVWGYGGIFSLGQQVFFGIGGYAYSVIAINLIPHTNETVSAVVGAALVAGLGAALIGYLVLYGEMTEISVAIITLALSILIYTVMATTAGPEYHIGPALLGGYNGVVGVPPLAAGADSIVGLRTLLVVCILVAAVIAIAVVCLLHAPFGRVLAAVRQNAERAELLGYDVRWQRGAVFVAGGTIAGTAGALFAAWGTFIDPTVFALQQAVIVVIWVLLGGRASVLGAFVGVAFVQWLSETLGGTGSEATPIVLGGILIAVVLLVPAGLVPGAASLLRRIRRRATTAPAETEAPPEADAVPPSVESLFTRGRPGVRLALSDASKSFGGVAAVKDVDLTFPARGVQCLIGPNGAGKSTVFGLLAGRHRPTSGDVLLSDQVINRQSRHHRAREGIGIKLQVASVFPELSAQENVWLAAYARDRNRRDATERALGVLQWLGMEARASALAGELAHGEQQWLEIGMVLAGEPAVILLDEPAAGMSQAETRKTAEMITALAGHAAVIVVEHNMEFLRLLDAPVTVLHQGQLFAQGSLAELREHPGVLDIYLGRAAHAGA